MKTIRNKAKRPLRVPLPQGKTLHLGPNREGQISDHTVDHPPFKKLLEAEEIEIVGEGEGSDSKPAAASDVHPETHGHQQAKVGPTKRGER